MIELSGKTPDVDIVIALTGLKPGDKVADIWSDDGEEFRPRVKEIVELLLSRDGSAGRLAVIEMPVQ